MDKELEIEATLYAESSKELEEPTYTNGLYYGFVAGANSKYSIKKNLESQLNILKTVGNYIDINFCKELYELKNNLEQELLKQSEK